MESQWTNTPTPKDARRIKSINLNYNFICIFFCCIDPLFWLGFRRNLKFTDLYSHPSEADSKYLLEKFNKYWSTELLRTTTGNSPRLLLVWFKCFWYRFLLQGLLHFIQVTITIAQALFLGRLSDYFITDEPSPVETRDAYLYAMAITLLAIFNSITVNIVYFMGYKLGALTRILMTSVIYQKILSLSQTVIGQTTVGRIVNLASNDVHKFELGFTCYHFLWLGPIHLIVVTYLLYQEVQWCVFIATMLIIIQLPMHLILSPIFIKLRSKAAKMTDKRLKVMNEVISGIRVIKMYGWEYAFRDVVAAIRKKEIYAIIKYFMIHSVSLSYDCLSISLIMFAMFSVYVSSFPGELTPRKVFIALSFITNVRMTTIFQIISSILKGSDAIVALKRIKKFFLLEELPSTSLENEKKFKASSIFANGEAICLHPMGGVDSNRVILENVCASWSYDKENLTLKNISLTLDAKNSLMAVIGTVGCGKSTLLQCLLGELPPISGSIQVNGSLSYSSQEAWIFSATMRENILFGLPYDAEKYTTILEACALDKDIETLQNGDLTMIGERGVTLSGGQKARVNLARACYREADVYLLDDPLSAVDAAVSEHIFNKCIRGLLSDKCVILVTHQIKCVNQCDRVLELREGSMGLYGDPKDILQNDNQRLLELLSSNEDDASKLFRIRSHSAKNILLKSNDLSENIKLNDIMEEEPPLNDVITALHCNNEVKSFIDEPETNITVAGLPEEESAHGRISMMTYCQYFIAGGGYIFTGIVVLVFILTETNMVMSDWWISDWADCGNGSDFTQQSTCNLSDNNRILVYGGIIGSLFIFAILRTALFVVLMLNSSRILHNRMFEKILRAPILFFDTNPIGRVLNRFSKDVGFLDDKLIHYFYDYLTYLTRFFAAMITASIANPYILVISSGVLLASLILRFYFLKTARDIKRLEALTRSPLYSHLSLTMQGLPTIRSLNMTNKALNQFHTFQNQHTQAAYLFVAANRWFCIRVDVFINIFIAVVAFASIPLSSTFNAGLLGLSLTYALSLIDFQYCLRLSGEVESLMVSAQRVMAYGKLETEASLENDPSVQTPLGWPTKGHIEINDLSYRHSNDGPLVLKGILCDIKPCENIGIVGRTGAGKSSLISALFRLAEPQGHVIIDGVDICQLGLHEIRSKLSIIPQDPVLFGGTVRYNLDPFNQFDDEQIWTALYQVQLKSSVEQLESIVMDGGSNFSVGQKQLFCLARALLRNNTILILDEATANVDLETDSIIQKVIREKFINCTTLTIAHRLDTVMDCDRIMLLRSGKLMEFDEPHFLLCDPSSYLSKLVDHTGPVAAQRLRDMALDAHNQRMM